MRCLRTVFILLLFTLSSCQKKNKIDLDRDKLISVLVDIQLGKEIVEKFKIADRDSVQKLIRKEISTIHGIDTLTLQRNIKALQSDPKLAFEIYSIVTDTIKAKCSQ